MVKTFCFGLFIAVICFFNAVHSFAAGQDRCSGEGIVVKNMTMLDLWYRKNSADCTILKKNYMFRIGKGDTVEIFSDLTCSRLYCEENPGYEKYKSLDADGNCRVRILPLCNLSDM